MFQFQNSSKFYQTSKQVGIESLLDLILKRYAAIDYVMSMEHTQGFKLILKAQENENKEKLFQKWLSDTARYQMSFDEYYQKHMPYRKSTKEEKEEILRKWGN